MAQAYRLGILDLGTNTFHLLIVALNFEYDTFEQLYRKRHFIKLAEGGIHTLSQAALDRGMAALEEFSATLEEYDCTEVIVIGTAALRTASNGQSFIQQVAERYGLRITLIDGAREAELIFRGVMLSMTGPAVPALIMDIGGGSVEFILTDGRSRLWAKSFPIGVSVLYEQFHRSEPLSQADSSALNNFLIETLAPLARALERYPVTRLIGASGTFDVIRDSLAPKQGDNPAVPVPLEPLPELIHEVRLLDRAAREARPDLPPERSDMIVVAYMLVAYVLRLSDCRELYVSDYALKEGIIAEHLEQNP